MSNDERGIDRYDDRNEDRYDDRDDALKIRVRGSRVVSVREWDGGRWKHEDIDRNERYVLRDGLLVHKQGERVRYYTDDNGDGIWTRSIQTAAGNTLKDGDAPDPVISGGRSASGDSQSRGGDSQDWDDRSGFSDDAYRFDLVNGQVTNLQEYDDGRWQQERIEANETWTFDGTNLIQTERDSGGREISTFADTNGDGIFTKVSEVFTASF